MPSFCFAKVTQPSTEHGPSQKLRAVEVGCDTPDGNDAPEACAASLRPCSDKRFETCRADGCIPTAQSHPEMIPFDWTASIFLCRKTYITPTVGKASTISRLMALLVVIGICWYRLWASVSLGAQHQPMGIAEFGLPIGSCPGSWAKLRGFWISKWRRCWIMK